MAVTINGTTGIVNPDGSAGTPSLAGSDTNTGMFFPAADTIAFAEGGAEAMRIDSSGNLGIGATSIPSGYKLLVGSSSTNAGIELFKSGSGAQGGYLNLRPSLAAGNEYNLSISAYDHSGDSNTDGLSINATDGISFCTGSNTRQERGRFSGSGYFLVGTTNETGDGGGNEIRPNDSNGGAIVVKKTSSSVSGNTFIYFVRDGTVRGSIVLNGTTAVSYNTTSDYRLKENIAPMTGALAKVALLKPCTYTWRSDGTPGQGFIAHELAEVVPDAVTGEKDAVDENEKIKPQAIDTSFLVATLTAAIQEQQALIESLTARIAALEAA